MNFLQVTQERLQMLLLIEIIILPIETMAIERDMKYILKDH